MYKKNLVFVAACLGLLLFGIGLITLGSVASDLQTKFRLDEISSGTLFSIMPVGILTGSLLFGPVCDRYGYKLILILASFGMFVGFEGIAYASSFSWLKIFIFLFGASGGIINGATNAVVADISTDSKAANLSMLGVFFGIGALGMPLVLGLLKNSFSFEQILAAVGLFTLATGVFYIFIQFPLSKKAQGFILAKNSAFLKDSLLILIAFFLFFQGSFEAIINNWTTTYLKAQLSVPENNILYALSLYVLGMTMMRLLTGSVFRSVSEKKIMRGSFITILSGVVFLKYAQSFYLAVTGLILLGGGLAAGFPVMLGITGSCYAERSGTAFSFVLVVSLIGNMLVNYLMGVIAKRYGIYHLTTVAFIELALMVTLSGFIFSILKKRNVIKS
jgi:FHS family glucose/mannose:H+ symporter-like MFS transporter